MDSLVNKNLINILLEFNLDNQDRLILSKLLQSYFIDKTPSLKK